MSVLKVAVASIIALSLVFSLALPALADTDESMPWTEDFQARVVKGAVTEVDEENQEYFKVLSGEDEIGIRVDEDTRYFLLDVQRFLYPADLNPVLVANARPLFGNTGSTGLYHTLCIEFHRIIRAVDRLVGDFGAFNTNILRDTHHANPAITRQRRFQ